MWGCKQLNLRGISDSYLKALQINHRTNTLLYCYSVKQLAHWVNPNNIKWIKGVTFYKSFGAVLVGEYNRVI